MQPASSPRRLHPAPAPADLTPTRDFYAFLLPLLHELGSVETHHRQCRTTAHGQRLLAQPAHAQQHALHQQWLHSPTPDAWLTRMLPDASGIDWIVLRQRLCAWAAALPQHTDLPSATLYPTLAAAFGALGNAHTHGYRHTSRAPWQPRRAAAIWQAALHQPLTWLGIVQCSTRPADTGTPVPVVARLHPQPDLPTEADLAAG